MMRDSPSPMIQSSMERMTSGISEWNKERGEDSERITIVDKSRASVDVEEDGGSASASRYD